MTDFIHETYEVDENLLCHLCGIAVPINVFRGVIDGSCNPLSLQIDHVIPKALGGSDSSNNLKPAHAFCNKSKSKFYWTEAKRQSAYSRISFMLTMSLDEVWTFRGRNNTCVFDACERVARAGDFWQYCVRHARFMDENPRSEICKAETCKKNSRSQGNGFCTSHAKQKGIVPTNSICEVTDCSKQVQRRFSNRFCQAHSREQGLAHTIEPGVRDKASHFARHKIAPSHGCYFCVEVDQKIEYFKLSQVDENDRDLNLRRFGEKYKLSAKPAEHFSSLLRNVHTEETCRWCILLESLSSQIDNLVQK